MICLNSRMPQILRIHRRSNFSCVNDVLVPCSCTNPALLCFPSSSGWRWLQWVQHASSTSINGHSALMRSQVAHAVTNAPEMFLLLLLLSNQTQNRTGSHIHNACRMLLCTCQIRIQVCGTIVVCSLCGVALDFLVSSPEEHQLHKWSDSTWQSSAWQETVYVNCSGGCQMKRLFQIFDCFIFFQTFDSNNNAIPKPYLIYKP